MKKCFSLKSKAMLAALCFVGGIAAGLFQMETNVTAEVTSKSTVSKSESTESHSFDQKVMTKNNKLHLNSFAPLEDANQKSHQPPTSAPSLQVPTEQTTAAIASPPFTSAIIDEKKSGLKNNRESKTAAASRTVAVGTYDEFKAALLSATVQKIALTSNIKLTESFNVFVNKTIIGNGHTIDVNFQKIGVALVNAVCTIEDVTLINQSNYSFFWSEYAGVTVNYKNVASSGQQFIYLSQGTANLEGKINASANGEEIFQGQQLTIAPAAEVQFTDTAAATAIYTGTGLQVGKGARLTVNARGLGMYLYRPNAVVVIQGSAAIHSTTDSAIRTFESGASLVVAANALLQASSHVTPEEAILLTNGSITVENQGSFEVTSEGQQSTVQTGNKLTLEPGANFLIANNGSGNALGAYALPTTVAFASPQGVDTWQVGQVNLPLPATSYQGPLTASFTLDTYVVTQHTTQVVSNNADFQANFDSGKVGKIAGGHYVKRKKIAPTTIETLTNKSRQIQGTAEPNAFIRVEVNHQVIACGQVDPQGNYRLLIVPQKIGTKVTAIASLDGLTAQASTIVIDGSPQLTVPSTIDFGHQEIPVTDKFVPLPKQRTLLVEDRYQPASDWTVDVREEQAFVTSDGHHLSERLFLTSQRRKHKTNQQDQPIWQGSGTAQLNLSTSLELLLAPTDVTGTYEGKLIWTLILAPT